MPYPTPSVPSPVIGSQELQVGLIPFELALAPAVQTIWAVAMRHLQAEINERQCSRSACKRLQIELETERKHSAALTGNREHLYAEVVRLMKENEQLKEKVFNMTQEPTVEAGATDCRLRLSHKRTRDVREQDITVCCHPLNSCCATNEPL
jgi:hypothetical protein